MIEKERRVLSNNASYKAFSVGLLNKLDNMGRVFKFGRKSFKGYINSQTKDELIMVQLKIRGQYGN